MSFHLLSIKLLEPPYSPTNYGIIIVKGTTNWHLSTVYKRHTLAQLWEGTRQRASEALKMFLCNNCTSYLS